MARIIIDDLTAAEVQEITQRASQENLSPRDYLYKMLWPERVTERLSIDFFIEEILAEIAKIPAQSEFNLRELLGIKWKKIPPGKGGALGKKFGRMVRNNEVPGVSFLRIDSSSYAIYLKK